MTRRVRDVVRNAMDAGLGIVLLKFLVGLVIVLSLTGHLKSVLRPFQALLGGGTSNTQPRTTVPQKKRGVEVSQTQPTTSEGTVESKRKGDGTMRMMEASTPLQTAMVPALFPSWAPAKLCANLH